MNMQDQQRGNSSTSSTGSSYKEATLGEVLSRPDSLAIALFLVLQILMTISGNALVFWTIFVTKRLHSAGYFFVASLAVADFLVGILVVPVSLLYHVTFNMKGKWIFGEAVCDAWLLANLWFCMASILSLCAVTWDRYVAITSPLRYTARMCTKHVIKLIVATWSASFAAAVVNSYALKTSPSRALCEVQGLEFKYSIPDFIFIYLLPLIAVIFVNIRIAKAVSRQLKRVQRHTPHVIDLNSVEPDDPVSNTQTNDSTLSSSKTKKEGAFKKEVKTFRTFLIVTGSFFFSWTPFFFVLLLDPISKIDGSFVYICAILTYINSASNPLVYGIFNKDFRQAMLASLKSRQSTREDRGRLSTTC